MKNIKKIMFSGLFFVSGMVASSGSYATPRELQLIPAPILGTDAWGHSEQRNKLLSDISGFFSEEEGAYINIPATAEIPKSERVKVLTQFSQVFNGLPYPEMTLSDGDKLFATHAFQDTTTKAMVVASNSGDQILATALLHNNCGRNNGRDTTDSTTPRKHNCDAMQTLTIFYPNTGENKEITNQLKRWVADQIKDRNKAMSKFPVLVQKKFAVQVNVIKG